MSWKTPAFFFSSVIKVFQKPSHEQQDGSSLLGLHWVTTMRALPRRTSHTMACLWLLEAIQSFIWQRLIKEILWTQLWMRRILALIISYKIVIELFIHFPIVYWGPTTCWALCQTLQIEWDTHTHTHTETCIHTYLFISALLEPKWLWNVRKTWQSI